MAFRPSLAKGGDSSASSKATPSFVGTWKADHVPPGDDSVTFTLGADGTFNAVIAGSQTNRIAGTWKSDEAAAGTAKVTYVGQPKPGVVKLRGGDSMIADRAGIVLRRTVNRVFALAAFGSLLIVAKAIGDADQAARDGIEIKLARSEIAAIRLELPEKYAASHPDEFPGPRSLVELWQSMRSRGVEEKPKRLVEFERIAASDARFTDRRCSVCGQPVPKHKSKCRRCGRSYTSAPLGGPAVV